MAKHTLKIVSGEIVDAVSLSELCRSCDVHADWVIELVNEGILEPQTMAGTHWTFSAVCITRVRTAVRLQRDLGVNKEGIGLVLDLLEERAQLRQLLSRLEPSLVTDDDG